MLPHINILFLLSWPVDWHLNKYIADRIENRPIMVW